MKDVKISMGIWGINILPDRFNTLGFMDFIPVLDRIKLCGETEGISGIELHVPTEITIENEADVKRVLDDYGLQMVQLCGHTWTEKHYIHGSLADVDPKIRQIAIDRVNCQAIVGADFHLHLRRAGKCWIRIRVETVSRFTRPRFEQHSFRLLSGRLTSD